ncbi:MAG: DUF1616 domain-containing protein [Methanolobus sp.]|nr:DUF1616 domain-containing protein [Methanolobus sp.]
MPLNTDLKVVIVLVLLTAFFILLPPLDDSPVRMALGIPMLLFLPGYALTAALFPGMDDLDGIERIALSFGLSIVVVPLIGFLLNYTLWGIRLLPVLVSLTVFTLAMVLIAIYRRRALGDTAFTVPFRGMYISFKNEMFTGEEARFDRMLSIVLVVIVLISVPTLVYAVTTFEQEEKFTEFYILGPEGMADNYSTQLESGDSVDVIVGIVNNEHSMVNYSLEVRLDNDSMDVPGSFQHISLEHNETWEHPLSLVPHDTGSDMKLQYLLYREDNMAEPYRDLRLWINVMEAGNVD